MKEPPKYKYIVVGKRVETPSVTTLELVCSDAPSSACSDSAHSSLGHVPRYVAGQYITVYFPETGTPEGKAYSISSAPSGKTLDISVKAIGEFSNRLSKMKLGDTFLASLPYGYFYSESDKGELFMIAGGIGVAPFRGMILENLIRNPSRKLVLLCSAKVLQDFSFKKELDELSAEHKKLEIRYFLTRETSRGDCTALQIGRIDRNKLESLDLFEKRAASAEFLICGSIPFTRDIWKALRGLGVSEELIYTEAFFSH